MMFDVVVGDLMILIDSFHGKDDGMGQVQMFAGCFQILFHHHCNSHHNHKDTQAQGSAVQCSECNDFHIHHHTHGRAHKATDEQ